MKKVTLIFLGLFIVGAGLRAVNVLRPVDTASWRESDIASIARNYVREGMNPFYPRIDWRGDGPGFAEMEFPLYPWLIAVCYKLFGTHEVIGRVITFIFSLLSLFFFFKLARYLLAEKGAIIASLFFVLSPLVISISNSLQPEGLMFLSYILAAYYFVLWLDDDSWMSYGLALGATALAILAKASAAHIGLLFCFLVLSKTGLRALRQPRIWVFGAVALLPSLFWYRHAHQLWLNYGNSLGVSNETHWAGLDLFTNPAFILGIERAELFYGWMPTGLILALLALVLSKNTKVIKYCLYWLIAIFAYYLLAARTTSDSWAIYYHVVSIPPVALMIGACVEALTNVKFQKPLLRSFGVGSLVLIAVVTIAGILHVSNVDVRLASKISILLALSVLLLVFLFFRNGGNDELKGSRSSRLNTLVIYTAVLCLAATCLYEVRRIRDDFQARNDEGSLNRCAKEFAPAIPESVLVVTSGGPCVDPTGFPVAYNSSYMFYWLDRKGFDICQERQSVDALKLLSDRGARYFIAEKTALKMKPGFEEELRLNFPLTMECDDAFLFQLTPKQTLTQSGRE